jgi:hypothetical protein
MSDSDSIDFIRNREGLRPVLRRAVVAQSAVDAKNGVRNEVR